jgi:hypothetical protein
MNTQNVMILERSSQNLQKISSKGKTVLEGVFAEFGIENRNGRIYEEKEYLPHLEYLKKDINNGNLLGELDHPERFEVSLGNVSHRVVDLWYDQNKRQILGRVEVLEGTTKGQIAKALLDAGVPLSISSRAAGTVNEDKTVQIQQIYTYDLVAKPGFESAQLHSVNEAESKRIQSLVNQLNESYNGQKETNLNKKLGILNENISIIDVTDKFPAFKLREEAIAINKNNNLNDMPEKITTVDEDAVQKWTIHFKNELSRLDEKLTKIENAVLNGNTETSLNEQVIKIKKYVEKLRKIQEDSLNWQSEIAVALNKVGTFADTLADKSNKHYNLTNKIVETVDYNANVINKTQDWVSRIATTTNKIGEAVDHNATMLNGINDWNEEMAKAVNALNEWGKEKAVAINKMHEWTGSIAKNLNVSMNYQEDMLGRAMSKSDAKKLVEWIELSEAEKNNPKIKNEINEILTKHSITNEVLNETTIKGLDVLDDTKAIKVSQSPDKGIASGVEFDTKTKTIISKLRDVKFKKGTMPKDLETIEADEKSVKVTSSGSKQKGIMTLDVTKSVTTPKVSITGNGPKTKDQNLKLDVKPVGKLKENLNRASDIKVKAANLDNKLSKIINTLEKQKELDEKVQKEYPFTALLSESDRTKFASLSAADKQKVTNGISQANTNDPVIIQNIWENLITNQPKQEEPLWLKAAPKKYKELYEKSSQQLKESLNARAEYLTLDTQYQIDNFWELSGLDGRTNTLNEVLVPKTQKDMDKNYDNVVNSIGQYMKDRYGN